MNKEKINIAAGSFTIGFVISCIAFMIINSCFFDYGVEDAKSNVKIFNKTYNTSYSYQDWIFYQYDIKAKHNPYKNE